MYLDVTFKDGTVSHVPLTLSHTVRVINPDQQVQDAFSLDGVASITLDLAGAPAATDPNPPVNVGAAEGPTLDPSQADVGSSGTGDASSAESASQPPAEAPGGPAAAAAAA